MVKDGKIQLFQSWNDEEMAIFYKQGYKFEKGYDLSMYLTRQISQKSDLQRYGTKRPQKTQTT